MLSVYLLHGRVETLASGSPAPIWNRKKWTVRDYLPLDVSDAITQHSFMKWSEIFVLIAHWLRMHSDAQSWQTSRAASLLYKSGSGSPIFLMQQFHLSMQSDPRWGLYDWLLCLWHLILKEDPAVANVIAQWFVMSSSSSSLFSTELRNAISWRFYEKWTCCLKRKYVILKIIHGDIWGKV